MGNLIAETSELAGLMAQSHPAAPARRSSVPDGAPSQIIAALRAKQSERTPEQQAALIGWADGVRFSNVKIGRDKRATLCDAVALASVPPFMPLFFQTDDSAAEMYIVLHGEVGIYMHGADGEAECSTREATLALIDERAIEARAELQQRLPDKARPSDVPAALAEADDKMLALV